jgi:hypothetical protein
MNVKRAQLVSLEIRQSENRKLLNECNVSYSTMPVRNEEEQDVVEEVWKGVMKGGSEIKNI